MAGPSLQTTYWSQTTEDLLAALSSSPAGLATDEAGLRLEKYGPNTIQAKKKASPLGLFLNQFKSPIIIILLFATAVSAFLGDISDAVIILIIVAGSATLSFVQEYRASNAVEKLLSQVSVKISLLRDGKVISLSSEQIVPGDVVLLSAGSLIPADGIVIEARDFFINQAVLTGETFPVEKMPGAVKATANGFPKRHKIRNVKELFGGNNRWTPGNGHESYIIGMTNITAPCCMRR